MDQSQLTGVNIGWLLGLASDPVTLGVLVFGVVSSIKRDLERRKPPVVWNPWLWRGLSLLTGLILAGLLHAVTGRAVLGLSGTPGVIVFGVVTGIIGIIGRDGLKTVLSWLGGMTPAAPAIVGSAEKVEVNAPPAPAPSGAVVTIERPARLLNWDEVQESR